MPDTITQLVCFDLGGVLIRLAQDWQDAFNQAGVAYPASMEDPAVRKKLAELVCKEEVGAMGESGFFSAVSELTQVSADALVGVSDCYLCGAFAGIDALLDDLANAGIQTACLSNTNANHWAAMTEPEHRNGLPLHRMNYRFASQLIGHRKPDPGIYRHVEQTTGLASSAILFFDDLIPNLDTARSRGWHAEHITCPDNPVSQIRDYLIIHGVL